MKVRDSVALVILAGLWTPVAGVLVAAVEVWIALAGGDNFRMSTILGVLGGTLAMIGPGAWSIDARLFRKKVYRKLKEEHSLILSFHQKSDLRAHDRTDNIPSIWGCPCS